MTTIASRVWTNYHLDTVHEDHPLRLLVIETRRLEAELEQMRALAEQHGRERDAMRHFAQRVMETWPDDGVDGCELQDAAVAYGLLAPVTATAPCGAHCWCAEFHDEDSMAEGVTCYRRTPLLTGRSEA